MNGPLYQTELVACDKEIVLHVTVRRKIILSDIFKNSEFGIRINFISFKCCLKLHVIRLHSSSLLLHISYIAFRSELMTDG